MNHLAGENVYQSCDVYILHSRRPFSTRLSGAVEHDCHFFRGPAPGAGRSFDQGFLGGTAFMKLKFGRPRTSTRSSMGDIAPHAVACQATEEPKRIHKLIHALILAACRMPTGVPTEYVYMQACLLFDEPLQ